MVQVDTAKRQVHPERPSRLSWLFKTRSVAEVLDEHRGVGPGFEFLRILLAMTIFYGHTALIMGRKSTLPIANGLDAASAHLATAQVSDAVATIVLILKTRGYVVLVPMFFALSGFLVTGSAVRVRSTVTFLRFRLLRILPALCVEVTLSAVILGACFTKLPLASYFADPGFFRYFGNIAGVVTFTLPGVFTGNAYPNTVNGALWTLPPEFYCYLIMAGLMVSTALWRRDLMLAAFAIGAAILLPTSLLSGFATTDIFFSTTAVVSCFLAGVLAFLYRDRIPLNAGLAALSAVVTLCCVPFGRSAFVMIPFLVYLTVWIGMQKALALPFMKGRDYSYGIYLYNFPITQALITIHPGASRAELIVVGLSVTIAFAALSWHFIEKPTLKMKRSRFVAP